MDPYTLGYAAAEDACNLKTGEALITHNAYGHSDAEIVSFVNGVIDGVAANNRKLRGLRVGTHALRSLGVKKTSRLTGVYKLIPVVETTLNFAGSHIELVIAPASVRERRSEEIGL